MPKKIKKPKKPKIKGTIPVTGTKLVANWNLSMKKSKGWSREVNVKRQRQASIWFQIKDSIGQESS